MDQVTAINQATVLERLLLLFDVSQFFKICSKLYSITLWVLISNPYFLTQNDLPYSLSA